MPETREFRPVKDRPCESVVILTVDEYEALRLIDKEGFSQEECSSYMQVARTTVQMIYNSARKKLADALVDGLPLRIEGGHYQLCDGNHEFRGCSQCMKHRCGLHATPIKEDHIMKIAIPLDENQQDVFRENGKDTIVQNPAAEAQGGAGIQAAQFLVDSEVTTLITVRCGQNAAEVFHAAGMKIYKSANKAAADDLTALEEGKLNELTEFHGGYHGIQ